MSTAEDFLDGIFPEAIAPGDLTRRGAAALAALVASEKYAAARLVRCARRADGAEILVLEIDVPLGQRRPVNDIRASEPIAIAYLSDDKLPQAYALRDGFPDVPHLNLAHDGEPRSLCLFEMPADEALRIATPYVLLERVRLWLRETAHGRLHGEDQPLDPVFASSFIAVVLPPGAAEDGEVLVGVQRGDDAAAPILLQRPDGMTGRGRARFACLTIVTAAMPHGRIRHLPRSMAELVDLYGLLGVDLGAPLRKALGGWVQDNALAPLLDHRCLLVVSTPIERTPGLVDAFATKGFFLDRTAGELGEALGVVARAPGGRFGAVLGAQPDHHDALKGLPTYAVDIRRGFDRALARAASGHEEAEAFPKVALVGAGALGSQVALDAARGGDGAWSIIDPDHLLPHNLARHALFAEHVGLPKATALAGMINGLLGPGAATPLTSDVQSLGDTAAPLMEADLVVDASASVPCSRWLACDSQHATPTASIFLNPSGRDLVVLREGRERATKLDHLEMLYYWELATKRALHTHLQGVGTIMPSGGCRNPSVQLSQSAVGSHAARAARELFGTAPPPSGSIVIWHGTGIGDLRVEVPGEPFVEVQLDGWTVAVRASIVEGIRSARAAAGTLETGGILVGGWDRQQRKAWIVAHLDPPPDSEHSPTGFIRGLVGVHQSLDHIERTTAVNLTYVGEWHTHPPLHTSSPSEDDRLLMRWIGDAVAFSDVPPLMMIGGEDGVRLMLGTVGCHALLDAPHVPDPDAAGSADSAVTTAAEG